MIDYDDPLIGYSDPDTAYGGSAEEPVTPAAVETVLGMNTMGGSDGGFLVAPEWPQINIPDFRKIAKKRKQKKRAELLLLAMMDD